ncbi:MAG: GC-type dockerin domain-anchored protein [Phycisphaerales bacterium]|jgi:hypothetical protein
MRVTRYSSLGTTRNPSRRTAGTVLAVAALTALGSTALADDLLVPSQYPTIQAALDAVTAGDTVVLAPGVYSGAGNEALQMPGVAFTLRGETGDPADVVIEGPSDPYIRVIHAMDFGAGASGTRLEDLTVTEFSGVNGGAIRVNGADLWFDNCVFSGNTTGNMGCFSSGYGGAFYTTGGELRFTDCVIRNNSAYDEVCSGHGGRGTGGGIYARGSGLVFERCLIEDNRAGGYSGGNGAAIGASESTVTLIDSTVRGNSLGGTGSGGGVAASRVISINTDFINNSASGRESTGRGGAISAGDVTIVGGRFVGNAAGNDSYGASGGAISARIVDITNAVFANNRVASYAGEPLWGAAISVRDGGTLTGVTFANNAGATGDADGEAVYAEAGDLALRNCVVDNGDWLGVDTATVTATWSCIVGGYPGAGNIDADPMLDAEYRPVAGSPVIDAGNTTLLPADAFDLDGDGDLSEPIPFDAAGLARAVDDPATPDTGVGSPVVDMGAYEVQVACRADFDGDGALTIFDFLAFQNAFDAGDLAADFDGDGSLTLFDFLAFQNEFAAGCD